MDRKLGGLISVALLLAALAPAFAQTDPSVSALLNDTAAPPTVTLDAVVLSTTAGDTRLQPTPGAMGTRYAFVTVLMFLDFPEKRADVRIAEKRPTLHLKMEANPTGRVYLVKAETNERRNNRAVKLGRSGFGSISDMTVPDTDWVVPATVAAGGTGVWSLVPSQDLAPGEYGVFTANVMGGMQIPGSGSLYAFGVD